MADSWHELICQYCLQSYNGMTDPRELTCGHIFCKSCLQSDFDRNSAITCPVCKCEHRKVNVDSLPKFGSSETDIIAVEKYKCDTCGEKDAVGFCEKCGELGCSVHKQCHEDLRHPIISLDLYGERPSSYRKVMCQTHNKEIVLTCDTCSNPTLLACVLCELESQECPDKTGFYSNKHHSIVPVHGRCKTVRQQLDNLLKTSTDNITKLCKVEKEVWQQFDKFSQPEDEPKGAAAYVDVPEYPPEQLARLTEAVEKYVDDLAKKKEILEQTQRATRLFLDESHPTEIIQNCGNRLMILQEASRVIGDLVSKRKQRSDVLESAFGQMQSKKNLDSNKTPAALTSAILSPVTPAPTYRSLRFLSEHDTPARCYSVSFTEDTEPHLLVACDFRLYLYNDTMKSIESLKAKYPTSAVEYDGSTYYVDEWNGGKVKKCTLDFDDVEVLFTYKASENVSLAVNNNYVAVTEPCTDSVAVYDQDSDDVESYDIDFEPRYIHFDEDGRLLVSGEGELSCLEIDEYSHTLDEVWRYSLDGACGICTDGRGYIFLGSDSKKVIHVLSPEGELVGRLSHRHLPLDPGGMSIKGDTLAIACTDDNSFKLFNFS